MTGDPIGHLGESKLRSLSPDDLVIFTNMCRDSTSFSKSRESADYLTAYAASKIRLLLAHSPDVSVDTASRISRLAIAAAPDGDREHLRQIMHWGDLTARDKARRDNCEVDD